MKAQYTKTGRLWMGGLGGKAATSSTQIEDFFQTNCPMKQKPKGGVRKVTLEQAWDFEARKEGRLGGLHNNGKKVSLCRRLTQYTYSYE